MKYYKSGTILVKRVSELKILMRIIDNTQLSFATIFNKKSWAKFRYMCVKDLLGIVISNFDDDDDSGCERIMKMPINTQVRIQTIHIIPFSNELSSQVGGRRMKQLSTRLFIVSRISCRGAAGFVKDTRYLDAWPLAGKMHPTCSASFFALQCIGRCQPQEGKDYRLCHLLCKIKNLKFRTIVQNSISLRRRYFSNKFWVPIEIRNHQDLQQKSMWELKLVKLSLRSWSSPFWYSLNPVSPRRNQIILLSTFLSSCKLRPKVHLKTDISRCTGRRYSLIGK